MNRFCHSCTYLYVLPMLHYTQLVWTASCWMEGCGRRRNIKISEVVLKIPKSLKYTQNNIQNEKFHILKRLMKSKPFCLCWNEFFWMRYFRIGIIMCENVFSIWNYVWRKFQSIDKLGIPNVLTITYFTFWFVMKNMENLSKYTIWCWKLLDALSNVFSTLPFKLFARFFINLYRVLHFAAPCTG